MVEIEITKEKYEELLAEPEINTIRGIALRVTHPGEPIEEPYTYPPITIPYAVVFNKIPGIKFIVKEN